MQADGGSFGLLPASYVCRCSVDIDTMIGDIKDTKNDEVLTCMGDFQSIFTED
jgi:hypothetical protein